MILSLRRRHRRIFSVITVVLPLAFIVGIAARKPIPATLHPAMPLGGDHSARVWERSDLFLNPRIPVQLYRENSDRNQLALHLAVPQDFVKPDVLVYWIPSASQIKDSLPDEANLLGIFNSTAFLSLPPDLIGKPGFLMLYSLADHEVIAASKPFSVL